MLWSVLLSWTPRSLWWPLPGAKPSVAWLTRQFPWAAHHSLAGQNHLTTLQPTELGGPGGCLSPVSQVGPPKPAGHWQLKLLMPCVQVPPF